MFTIAFMKAIDLGHIITDYVNNKGDMVSPKKLQKLIYYVDAWHLVYFDEPLIEENFEAWIHGPVIPELYRKLRKFGFNNIQIINDEFDDIEQRIEKSLRETNINSEQSDLIFSVLNKYGILSSFELEMLTHSEPPWLTARSDTLPHERCKTIISKDLMKKFYTSLLKK